MQLPITTEIAGHKTVNDWNLLRPLLIDFKNIKAWEIAFTEYFKKRLQDRYFDPIAAIQQGGCYTGEGFSIMTIICSLMEFLESTYKGKNYRLVKKGDLKLNPLIEYSNSSELFSDFLSKRPPFKNHFNKTIAEEFYINVRCGLLHEARTKGKWNIRAKSASGLLIDYLPVKIVVFRDDFFDSTIEYIDKYYKVELLKSDDLKKAFIRKFDNICKE